MEEKDEKIIIEYKPNDFKPKKNINHKKSIPKYTMENHMKYKLSQLEGKDLIPNEILEQIKNKLKEGMLPTTRTSVRSTLKELKLCEYIDYIPSILNHLNKDNELIKITVGEPQECPICLNGVKEFIKLTCKHLFCESCIDQIKKDNQIKCPLCRNMQNIFEWYILTLEEKNIIIDEFTKTMDQYRTVGGRNFISFDLIIQDIAQKKGIKLNLV